MNEFWKAWSIWSIQCFMNITTKPCNTFEYFEEDPEIPEKIVNKKSFQFDYEIPSNSTTIYEQYWLYDEINFIGSVGGTLGMCIGFSFTSLVSSLLNILQYVIFIMKAKLANRKLFKSNPLKKDKQKIGDMTNQNKLTDMQRYQRTYFEKDLEKRIYNIIQDKIEAKLNLFENQIYQSMDDIFNYGPVMCI